MSVPADSSAIDRYEVAYELLGLVKKEFIDAKQQIDLLEKVNQGLQVQLDVCK
jgi:hypothetical protein